uniref:aldo/keto reductase n=1 Tax=Escherichia coli TaxID=562 RepID=UPI001374B289
RFVSMQDQYNLIQREEEREMHPLCAAEGIAVLPWSPLARGRLTRPWGETTARLVSDQFGKSLYDETEGIDAIIAERVASLAEERGVPRAQIALAWLLAKPGVASPLVGMSKPHHLQDALAALNLSLSPQDVAALEAPMAHAA